MKISLQKFPPYHKQYPWSPVPDNADIFVGREIELVAFWYQMANLVNNGEEQPTNLAFVGQRKLGKTAYLKRCYNISFWEQDEVIPFYYSFPQNEQDAKKNVLQIKDLQHDIPILLLQQLFAFYSKDQNFTKGKDSIKKLLNYAKKINFPKFEEFSELVLSRLNRINNTSGIFILKNIWEMTQWLSSFMGKKCLLIIDEAQEMQCSIHEGKEQFTCKGSIADIIQKQQSLVLISGSHISMLVNKFLDYDFANRFQKIIFSSLEEEDAETLVKKKCPKGYKNLATDLVKMVGGNAFYINKILSFNLKYFKYFKKNKDFSSPEGLEKSYNFEVLNSKGNLYNFWNTHLVKNKEDLNRDPKSKKGLTLQILYKIVKNSDREIQYHEFLKDFDINEETLEQKLTQLENANLIIPTGIGEFAHGFFDKILPAIINQSYHQLLRTGPSKKISEEAVRDFKETNKHIQKEIHDYKEYAKSTSAKIKKAKKSINKQMKQISLQVANIEKGVKQIQGIINFKKGAKAESKVRQKIHKMIQKQQGIFSGFQLEGDVSSVNITGSKGEGCQIDVYAKLKHRNKRGSIIFMAEIKNVKTKVSLKQAQKFVASMRKVKDVNKLKKINAVYISTAGFVKTAEKYLDKHSISIGYSVDVLA